ncbi:TPR repeat protein [Penicillium waksmanii]|uniref:TPR repeat protein n=1 Tax=Penicillium waksmanii TaxID=69791 RepID=UPI002546C3FA|nr:TPR repeat protein [Penicillium waksmanii]KAJ5975808.1 TPR repeat protein [Penicillium waksmanii]
MPGIENIGVFSTVGTLLDQSLQNYQRAYDYLKVAGNLWGTLDGTMVMTRETARNPQSDSNDALPENLYWDLNKKFDACDKKSRALREVIARIIPRESNRSSTCYSTSGSEDMSREVDMFQDVEDLANNDIIHSTRPEKKTEREKNLPKFFDNGREVELRCENQAYGLQNNIYGQQNIGGIQQYNYVNQPELGFSFHHGVGMNLSQTTCIDPNYFKGRDNELAEMTRILNPIQKPLRQQCLTINGKGGLGKTQLAIAYAKLYCERDFPAYDSVILLNATSKSKLKESFRRIAKRIFKKMPESEDAVHHTLRWLSDPKNTGWLLIFDEYDDPDQFSISNYFPGGAHGSILITTQSPTSVPGISFCLRSLDEEGSLAVLAARSERANSVTDPAAKEIVKLLGGLPLALATAGAYIRRNKCTLEYYLKEYKDHWIFNSYNYMRLPEYNKTLHTVWNKSFARLKSTSPEAAKLLAWLAYFDNPKVQHELISPGRGNVPDYWQHQMKTEDRRIRHLMEILVEFCFLDVTQTEGSMPASQSWTMHNCVHAWTLAVLNREVYPEFHWYAFDCVTS